MDWKTINFNGTRETNNAETDKERTFTLDTTKSILSFVDLKK